MRPHGVRLFRGELKQEVLRKSAQIPPHLLVQAPGGHAVEASKVDVKHHPPPPNDVDEAVDFGVERARVIGLNRDAVAGHPQRLPGARGQASPFPRMRYRSCAIGHLNANHSQIARIHLIEREYERWNEWHQVF